MLLKHINTSIVYTIYVYRSGHSTRLINRDVSVRDVSDIPHLFAIPVKFSDAIVRLLDSFLVVDMAMQLLQVTCYASLWYIYVHKARAVSAPNVFV